MKGMIVNKMRVRAKKTFFPLHVFVEVIIFWYKKGNKGKKGTTL